MKTAAALLFALATLLPAQSETPRKPVQKWEYCYVWGADASDGTQGRLVAYIRYFTEKGIQEETEEILVNKTGRSLAWRLPEVMGKTLAKLGDQGWEMVSVQYKPESYVDHAFFLKRPKP